ncbi:vascular cell adhesion protein 1-like [Centropristis striata]|uniref:vascular cell adhesion protein 1-like n=1 Tax=Centropristis striata TaxID=184440 RepID=UPI0027E1640D|nr:vascular cell adhesion protein 1-like [Centropristis striata]
MKWFFVLSGLIAYTGKPVSTSCPVQMSPSRVVVRFEDPFSVNCSSPSDHIDSMGWESIYGVGIGSTDNVSSVSLKIKSVKDWNIAPICFMNFLDGTQCTEPLPVTVYKTPDTVSMWTNHKGLMVEGVKYEMHCDIVNVAPAKNLSVLWYKGNQIVSTHTFSESELSPVNKSHVYRLIPRRGDNGSPIWCEAKLHFRPAVSIPTVRSNSYEAVVLYSPAFTNPENETLELSSGSKLILNCSATGNPMPVYSWGFPHEIQQTTKINENESILTPSIGLPGSYNCTVSNTRGTRTKYFTVIEAKRDPTVIAALVGVFGVLGVVALVAGAFFVKSDGTFPCNKGSYIKGQPTSSGPV